MLDIPTLLSYITVRVPYSRGPSIAATRPKKPKKPKNSALRVSGTIWPKMLRARPCEPPSRAPAMQPSRRNWRKTPNPRGPQR